MTNINATRQNQIYILTILFLGAVGFFMVWVYLALSIEERFELSKPAIGAIVGSMVLFTSGLSWLGGIVGDRFGQIRVLRYGLIVYVPVTLVMALTNSLYMLITMIAAMGIIRSMTTPSTKALCVMADDGSGRMFRFRYLAIAASFATVGTIAMILKPERHADLFYIAALLMLITSFATIVLPQSFKAEEHDEETATAPIAKLPRVPVALLIAFGASMFMLLSQFETSLPLHLNDVFGKTRGAEIYSVEVIFGSIFGFLFALAYDQIVLRCSSVKPAAIVGYAVVMVILGALIMYQATTAFWVYFGAATFISAEVMLFPMMDSMATKFMTKKNRGQIMGLLEIRQLAFFIGPVLGGFMLEISPMALILFHCFCASVIGMCYMAISKLK